MLPVSVYVSGTLPIYAEAQYYIYAQAIALLLEKWLVV